MSEEDREARLSFAIPPIHEPPEDLVVEWLDPGDEDDRSVLLALAHPELDTDEETMVFAGQEMNPRLHLVIHEIVAKQLADDDPPEVWETARRLRRAGYHQHEILHMLGSAMSSEIWHAMQGHRGYDREAHLAALAALPDSWERQRPGAARLARLACDRGKAPPQGAARRPPGQPAPLTAAAPVSRPWRASRSSSALS